MRAGWDSFVDCLGLGEVASVSVFVICVVALCCQCCVAVYRGARERRIVRVWARPTRVSSPGCEARGRWGRLFPGEERSARHRGRAQGSPTPRELSLLVAEVATRLRAGAPTSLAWGLALARIDAGGSVGVDDSYPAVLDEWARRVAAAGPLMSARVLAALPLVGIACALALGASPWQFYTGSAAGWMCALAGVAAWAAGVASCRRILARCRRVEEGIDGALACDLVASALACGAAIPRALDALADACAAETLSWAAASLRLGATWADAWEDTPEWSHPLRDALEASWTSGTAPDTLLARSAAWERRSRLVDAKAQAEELSVRLVGPLGVFFLPAFLALGIAPLLAHLMGGIGV